MPATGWAGGMTNGEMFTFSAGEAWMIRNGQIAEPVRDVTLSGNVFQTLADIEAIGMTSTGMNPAAVAGRTERLTCGLWWWSWSTDSQCRRWWGGWVGQVRLNSNP